MRLIEVRSFLGPSDFSSYVRNVGKMMTQNVVKAVSALSAYLIIFAAGCSSAENCQTQGAVKVGNVCECPEGTQINSEQNRCQSVPADSDTDAGETRFDSGGNRGQSADRPQNDQGSTPLSDGVLSRDAGSPSDASSMTMAAAVAPNAAPPTAALDAAQAAVISDAGADVAGADTKPAGGPCSCSADETCYRSSCHTVIQNIPKAEENGGYLLGQGVKAVAQVVTFDRTAAIIAVRVQLHCVGADASKEVRLSVRRITPATGVSKEELAGAIESSQVRVGEMAFNEFRFSPVRGIPTEQLALVLSAPRIPDVPCNVRFSSTTSYDLGFPISEIENGWTKLGDRDWCFQLILAK